MTNNMVSPIVSIIPVSEAIGHVLCHDVTSIVPGRSKGPLFRKGHRICAGDIPALQAAGKEHIYVYRETPGILHENDAARFMARLTGGKGLSLSAPREGRINFIARAKGLLMVDIAALKLINSHGGISLATMRSGTVANPGQPVAGTRIIPLFMEESRLNLLKSLIKKPVLEILPFTPIRAGIVTTGNEVLKGLVEDAFAPVLRRKFSEFGCRITRQIICGDRHKDISAAISTLIEEGAEMVVCTGGMSVDPDDLTPMAIRSICPEVAAYGAPVFPGAMFMLAWTEKDGKRIPVMGLPGCVMYHKATIFDLILPRILAGLEVTGDDIASMGHGSFCQGCAECRFPNCQFGNFS